MASKASNFLVVPPKAAALSFAVLLACGISPAADAQQLRIEMPEGNRLICDSSLMEMDRDAGQTPTLRPPEITISVGDVAKREAYRATLYRLQRKMSGGIYRAREAHRSVHWRKPNATLEIDNLRPGRFVATLERYIPRRRSSPGGFYVQEEREFTIDPPEHAIEVMGNTPFDGDITVSTRNVGTLGRLYRSNRPLTVEIKPIYANYFNGARRANFRQKRIPYCADNTYSFRELDPGNYVIRIYDSAGEIYRSNVSVGARELSWTDRLGRFIEIGTDDNALPVTPNAQALTCDILEAYSNDPAEIAHAAEYADEAILSWAAYDDPEAIRIAEERGWKVISPYVDENFLVGDTVAALFRHDDGRQVLAFRGTTGGLFSRDMITNAAGALGQTTEQVIEAQNIARLAEREFGAIDGFVGHSLGGRLAQAAAVNSGKQAVVFQSSPVSLAEAARPFKDFEVIGFRTPEDPVSALSPGRLFTDSVIQNYQRVNNVTWLGDLAASSHTHSAAGIARAMMDAGIVQEAGWINNVVCPNE